MVGEAREDEGEELRSRSAGWADMVGGTADAMRGSAAGSILSGGGADLEECGRERVEADVKQLSVCKRLMKSCFCN